MRSKLNKTERKELEHAEWFLNEVLISAEKSWSSERLKEEIKDYGHNEKKNKQVHIIRTLKLKQLGL